MGCVDAEGKILLKKSLALRKPNYKLRGWQGAEFRVRLDRKKVATGTLVLTFHDDRCYGDLTFDCSANKSVAVTEKKRAADVQ